MHLDSGHLRMKLIMHTTLIEIYHLLLRLLDLGCRSNLGYHNIGFTLRRE